MNISFVSFFQTASVLRSLVKELEELKYNRLMIGEHHTHLQCPSPMLAAAIVAAAAPKIRLGTAAIQLGFTTPDEVIEHVEMFAEAYGDRFDLGVIAGAPEVVEQDFKALREGLPGRTIWVSTGSPSTAIHAAAIGAVLCASQYHPPFNPGPAIDAYRKAYADASQPPHVVLMVGGICGTPELCAKANAEMDEFHQNISTLFPYLSRPSGVTAPDPTAAPKIPSRLHGDAATWKKYLSDLIAEYAPDELLYLPIARERETTLQSAAAFMEMAKNL